MITKLYVGYTENASGKALDEFASATGSKRAKEVLDVNARFYKKVREKMADATNAYEFEG